MRTSLRVLLAVALSAASAATQDGRESFLRHCATCHGTTGHGDGPAKVQPTPRDLTSGRFSFGTTTEAIERTVRGGIAPTMPAFADSLTDQELAALVGYVRSLMPATVEASPAESRIEVGTVPRVISGALPPRANSTMPITRGLAVCLPGGWTVEYATDDFRMLQILHGDGYVDRTDWRGRGGSQRELLGTPLDPLSGDDLGPVMRTWDDESAMSIRYLGHRIDGATVILDGEVYDGRRKFADYREIVRSLAIEEGGGVHRRLEFRATISLPEVRIAVGMLGLANQVNNGERNTVRGRELWRYGRESNRKVADVLVVRGPRKDTLTLREGKLFSLVPLGDRPVMRLDVMRLRVPRFSQQMIPDFAKGFDE